ncbi:MAG TPA: hypothetical protein PKM44_16065 [Turneriella sp.]|nr:hypothetical protein [Turneriella sp.]HNM99449.1 hypothetical protein [Turneriella sp.]
MEIQETREAAQSQRLYEAQQAAQQEAQNRVEPVQKDQPAQATGTASTIDTYA